MANVLERFASGLAGIANAWSTKRQEIRKRRRPPFIAAMAEEGRYGIGERPLEGVQERALRDGWFYTALSLIAGEVSAAQFDVLKHKGVDEEPEHIPNHPLEALLRRPNPFMGKAYFWRYLTFWLYLNGNAYIYILLGPKGRPVELWPLPSKDVEPYPPQDLDESQKFIDYYEYTAQGAIFNIPSEYVVHIKFPHPFDPFRGLSPLVAAMVPVDSDMSMADWNLRFFGEDNVMPSAVINLSSGDPNVPVNPADVTALKEDLRVEYKARHRKTAITSAQRLEVEMLGYNPKDLDWSMGREMTKKEILHILGVPDGILDATSANIVFGNTTQAERMLKNSVYNNVLVLMGEQMTAELVIPYYGKRYEGRFEDIRPTNRDALMSEVSAFSPFMTIDEVRKTYLELEALPKGRGRSLTNDPPPELPAPKMPFALPSGEDDGNGSQTPRFLKGIIHEEEDEKAVTLSPVLGDNGDVVAYVYSGVVTVEDIDAEFPDEGLDDPGDPLDEFKKWKAKSLKALKRDEPAQVPFHSDHIPDILVLEVNAGLHVAETADEVKSIFNDALADLDNAKALGDRWRPWINRIGRFRNAISRAFGGIGRDVERAIREDGPGGAVQNTLWLAYRDRLAKVIAEPLGDLVADTLNKVEREHPGVSDWKRNRELAAEWASRYAAQQITRISDTTRKQIQEALSQWSLEGGTEEELVELLVAIVVDPNRAALIAQTEATNIVAESASQALVATGIPQALYKPTAHPRCRCFLMAYKLPGNNRVMVWYTFRDERVCRTPYDVPWQDEPVEGCRDLHNRVMSEGPFIGMKVSRAASFARRMSSAGAIMRRGAQVRG